MKKPTGPEWEILNEIEVSIDTGDLTLEQWGQLRSMALVMRNKKRKAPVQPEQREGNHG